MAEDAPPARPRRTLADLLAIMAALRHPQTGCPWDRKQSFATIAPYTIEEAYEVADAIERQDMADLKDELGDLLFQVVYHAQMAAERGAFGFDDVAAAIADKMVRRHPHVFGTEAERAAGAPAGFWERIKAEERAAKGKAETPAPATLDGVPVGLPGLTRAVKLQDKAAGVGFDWPSLAPVLAKVREELAELEAEIAAGNGARIEEELGDLLFVLANVARWTRTDPERAVRSANAKFERRFRRIEAALAAEGRTPAQSSLEEMDRIWNTVKREEAP